jgi:hypothetical protein
MGNICSTKMVNGDPNIWKGVSRGYNTSNRYLEGHDIQIEYHRGYQMKIQNEWGDKFPRKQPDGSHIEGENWKWK